MPFKQILEEYERDMEERGTGYRHLVMSEETFSKLLEMGCVKKPFEFNGNKLSAELRIASKGAEDSFFLGTLVYSNTTFFQIYKPKSTVLPLGKVFLRIRGRDKGII